MLEFAVSELPSIYSSIISWLQPPYLYILINAIIISILASSKLQPKSQSSKPLAKTVSYPVPPPVPVDLDYETYTRVALSSTSNVNDTAPNKVQGNEVNVQSSSSSSNSRWTSLQRDDSLEFSLLNDYSCEKSKPPAYSRLSRHKSSIKANLQGKPSLGVSKPRRGQDTFEATWRQITESRPMPLTRQHLMKSMTRPISESQNKDSTVPTMKKMETFAERSSIKSRPPLNRLSMRREPSLSQEELNRRVEAFINKFNEDMRLQRQQSLDQYRAMISCDKAGTGTAAS